MKLTVQNWTEMAYKSNFGTLKRILQARKGQFVSSENHVDFLPENFQLNVKGVKVIRVHSEDEKR